MLVTLFQKLKKPKLSKIKRNNQTKTKLSKQGKLKGRRHKKPKKQPQKAVPPPKEEVEEEESDHGEDLMDMVEEDDLNFLKKAISDKSYNLVKQIRLTEYDVTYFVNIEKIDFSTKLIVYYYWFQSRRKPK